MLQIPLYNGHLECSKYQHIMYIWSTPDINSRSSSWSQPATQSAGLLHNHSACYTPGQPGKQPNCRQNNQPACYTASQPAPQPTILIYGLPAYNTTSQPASQPVSLLHNQLGIISSNEILEVQLTLNLLQYA